MIIIFFAAILHGLGYIGAELGAMVLVAGLLTSGLLLLHDALFKPKASLHIRGVHFEERAFDGVRGHQLKARVLSKGVVVTNLTASFEITPPKGVTLNLLDVVVSVDKFRRRKVVSEEIPLKRVGYAWVTDDGKKRRGPWEELREGDRVGLVYPAQPLSVHVGWKSIERYSLLKLHENVEYRVTIEVRGEDPDGNIVTGKSTTTLKL